ncbi:MAG: ribbon-helix-helix protein, CopG family [Acidobacteriota bacterium]
MDEPSTHPLMRNIGPAAGRSRRRGTIDLERRYTYVIHMKAIQITMDEELLSRLDEREEVKNHGRSRAIREAVEEWLRRRREESIVDRYRKAYGKDGGLGAEWSGWEEQGTWLDR